MNARLAACAVAVLTAGCATLPPAGDGDWPLRREALQTLDGWTLNGRVAVAAGGEGFSGGLRWRQDGTRAEIDLRGPLGGTALAIRVDGDAMTVTDANGATIDGEEARRTAAGFVGVPLPLPQLRYWLVGAPAPHSPYRETIGEGSRLGALEQAGWHVRYTRYGAAGARVLPERLEMTSGGVRLRLAVASWQFAP